MAIVVGLYRLGEVTPRGRAPVVDDFAATRSRMELRKRQPQKDAIETSGEFCACCGTKDPMDGCHILQRGMWTLAGLVGINA
jgi:hypothetical protein